MITKEQALTANEFHSPRDDNRINNKRRTACIVWRRNGSTKTWVTRPNDFRVPVKHGIHAYGEITQDNAEVLHTAEDCPHNKQVLIRGQEEGIV